MRVAKEVKGAGSNNFLAYLWLVLPVSVDGCSIESSDIAGSDRRSTLPLNAMCFMGLAVMTTRVTLVVWVVMRVVVRILVRALIAFDMGFAVATELTMLRLAITLLMVWTKRLAILFSVDFSVGSEGRDDDEGTGSGESVHYFDFSN